MERKLLEVGKSNTIRAFSSFWSEIVIDRVIISHD